MPLFGLGVTLIMISDRLQRRLRSHDRRRPRLGDHHRQPARGAAAPSPRSSPPTGRRRRSTSHGRQRHDRRARRHHGPSGYVDTWASIPIGLIAGVIVPLAVYAIDRRLDDPVGALSAHGLCACGARSPPASSPRRGWRRRCASVILRAACSIPAASTKLAAQAVGLVIVIVLVFAMCWLAFWLIRRPTDCGSPRSTSSPGSISPSTACYGYPEQFIPEAEMFGAGASLTPDYARWTERTTRSEGLWQRLPMRQTPQA